MASKFKIGDFVWARMKGFPAWPGKVIEPDLGKRPAGKLKRQYVFFYGSENHAWIPEDQIWSYVPNKEKFVLTSRLPKGFKEAVEAIEEIVTNLPPAQPSTSNLPTIEDELAVIFSGPGAKGRVGKDYTREPLVSRGKGRVKLPVDQSVPSSAHEHLSSETFKIKKAQTTETKDTQVTASKSSKAKAKPPRAQRRKSKGLKRNKRGIFQESQDDEPAKYTHIKLVEVTIEPGSDEKSPVVVRKESVLSVQKEMSDTTFLAKIPLRKKPQRMSEARTRAKQQPDIQQITSGVSQTAVGQMQVASNETPTVDEAGCDTKFYKKTRTSAGHLGGRVNQDEQSEKEEQKKDRGSAPTPPTSTEKKPKEKPLSSKKRSASPHTTTAPKKSRLLKMSPSTPKHASVNSHDKKSAAATASVSSTSTKTPSGHDGWNSSTTFRKESPLFERTYDRVLDPSMVEPILSKNIIPTPLKIGFLGLGLMGSGMVSNLLTSGHEVTVWNRTPSKCKEFIKEGALKGNSPSEVVQLCDITLSCVADPTALKDLVFGNCGVLQGISQGKAYVDMSTVDVETITDVHEAVTARGGRFLEAPVIGSKQPAAVGNLLVLAAGDRSLYDDCYSCFEAMGKRTFYLGEIGSAAKMELVLSLFMGTVIAGLAESLALAEKVGLEQEEVLQILELSPASCPLVRTKGNAMISNNYSDPHCKLHTYQKDLRLAVNMSDTVDQPLHVGSAVNELFKKAKAKGYGEHDTAAVYRAADL